MKSISFFTVAVVLLLCSQAGAMEAMNGKVNHIEATYLPGVILFRMDSGSPSCPAGATLRWQKEDHSNVKAVYATLLTAMVSGKRIVLYVNDGDTECIGQFLHIVE